MTIELAPVSVDEEIEGLLLEAVRLAQASGMHRVYFALGENHKRVRIVKAEQPKFDLDKLCDTVLAVLETEIAISCEHHKREIKTEFSKAHAELHGWWKGGDGLIVVAVGGGGGGGSSGRYTSSTPNLQEVQRRPPMPPAPPRPTRHAPPTWPVAPNRDETAGFGTGLMLGAMLSPFDSADPGAVDTLPNVKLNATFSDTPDPTVPETYVKWGDE